MRMFSLEAGRVILMPFFSFLYFSLLPDRYSLHSEMLVFSSGMNISVRSGWNMCRKFLLPFFVDTPHGCSGIIPVVVAYMVSPYLVNHSPIACMRVKAASGRVPSGLGPMFKSKLAPLAAVCIRYLIRKSVDLYVVSVIL